MSGLVLVSCSSYSHPRVESLVPVNEGEEEDLVVRWVSGGGVARLEGEEEAGLLALLEQRREGEGDISKIQKIHDMVDADGTFEYSSQAPLGGGEALVANLEVREALAEGPVPEKKVGTSGNIKPQEDTFQGDETLSPGSEENGGQSNGRYIEPLVGVGATPSLPPREQVGHDSELWSQMSEFQPLSSPVLMRNDSVEAELEVSRSMQADTGAANEQATVPEIEHEQKMHDIEGTSEMSGRSLCQTAESEVFYTARLTGQPGAGQLLGEVVLQSQRSARKRSFEDVDVTLKSPPAAKQAHRSWSEEVPEEEEVLEEE